MSLSTRILLGLLLGIALGLFFGEPMGALSVAGDAYVGLLQMTVLPYVVVSLVAGLGSLSYAEARRLALHGGGLLLLLWGVAFVVVVSMTFGFPDIETGSFFSTTLVERPPPFDVVALYVPSNPFASLANSDVPAVVLFSIAVGVALMGVGGKEPLLRGLDTLAEALMRVTRWIVRLTPYGVFAIGASAAGTMSVDEFEKIQVYLVSYVVFALLLSFWVLPGLVAALTGLPHREIAGSARDALVTAFATGNDFVVLPLLTEHTKKILARHGAARGHDGDAIVDVVIPVSHNFPHTAKILSLSFVAFAAWFNGETLGVAGFGMLGGAGIASTFGSVNLAIPFLLDLFHLPSDLFNLFVATSVVNARFGTLLAAMHGFCLALLVTCALTGTLKFSMGRVLRFAATTLVLVAAVTAGVRVTLERLVAGDDPSAVLDRFEPALEPLEDVRVFAPTDEVAEREEDPKDRRIESIFEEGRLRACYLVGRPLPFSWFDDEGRFVGLDVEMAHSLARGLGVGLDFVPFEPGQPASRLGEALESGYCDVGLGNAVAMDQSVWIDYSIPYLDLTMALMVPDHRRSEFALRERIDRMRGLRVAVPRSPYYEMRVSMLLPSAELVPVDSFEAVLAGDVDDVDALVYLAEIGSAYSLLYPSWSVVVPEPPLQKVPVGFVLPQGDPDWLNYVNSWIELKKRDGTLDQLYEHWILGRGAAPGGPRWSIARDVLHWIE